MNSQLKALFYRGTKSIRSSITKKYVILFAIIFIIPMFFLYQFIVGYAERMIERDIIERNVSNADSIVKRIDKEITDIVLQLQLISGTAVEDELYIELMYERSKLAISQSPIIHSINFLNQDKKVMFEAPFVSQAETDIVYHHPDFDQVKWTRNYAVSNHFINYHGNAAISVSIPVLNKKQQLKGVLLAEISHEYVADVLKSFSATNGHFSYIMDRKGEVISSTHKEGSGFHDSTEVVFRKLFQDSFGVMKESFLGEKSVIAYQTTRDGLGVVYGVPEHIAFEPIRKLSYLFTISFLIILALSLLFIWVGMRNIVYPIVRLTNYAKQYRQKTYYQPEDSSLNYTNDELGELRKTIISVGNSNYEKQKMLEEKEQYLHDVIEGIPYGIITVDKDGVITYVNQQFEKMVGYHRDSMIGLLLPELPIKNNDGDFALLHTLVSEKSVNEQESYLINSEGQKLIVKIATSRFYNEKKEFIGSIAILLDVSQIKLLESRLKQNDKLALIGQITTGIAHEIKNPLAILAGSVELLVEEAEETECSTEIIELSKDVAQVVKRMTAITNNFLNFAKINQSEAAEVDVSHVMEEVLHLVRFKVNEAKIEIKKNYAETSSLIGQYEHLIQAFLNLILNAIEAMSAGGTLTVSIGEEHDDRTPCIFVEITDTGPGILEKDMKWLFDPFFSTKEEGNGLGLTIARDIIREHNGELKIESTTKGTTITCIFCLPKGRRGSYD